MFTNNKEFSKNKFETISDKISNISDFYDHLLNVEVKSSIFNEISDLCKTDEIKALKKEIEELKNLLHKEKVTNALVTFANKSVAERLVKENEELKELVKPTESKGSTTPHKLKLLIAELQKLV
ncbi:hypothetical protein R3B00_001311 [Klebsiella pneumoniae]|nr:hypothetical protein [Klebsiella pneumoniae]ELQ8980649.1 hypothetical protein [Klebsiella pneumoniae]